MSVQHLPSGFVSQPLGFGVVHPVYARAVLDLKARIKKTRIIIETNGFVLMVSPRGGD